MMRLDAWIEEMRSALDQLETLNRRQEMGIEHGGRASRSLVLVAIPANVRVGVIRPFPPAVDVEESLLPTAQAKPPSLVESLCGPLCHCCWKPLINCDCHPDDHASHPGSGGPFIDPGFS